VRDVRPPRAVALGHLDRVAEHRGLGLRPQLAEALDRELALLAPRRVHGVLEPVHRDLAEHRGDLALERLGEQGEARLGVVSVGEEPPERDRLAEHRRGLGEGERGRLLEDDLVAGEVGVHAVPELVGEREDVAAAGRPVEEQVRMV